MIKDLNFYKEDERQKELLTKQCLTPEEFEELTEYSNIYFESAGISGKDGKQNLYDVDLLDEEGQRIFNFDIYVK